MHNFYILLDFEIAIYRNRYKYVFLRFSKNIEENHDEKLAIKLSQRSQSAFRYTYSDPRTESNRAGKSNVTYHAPLRPKARRSRNTPGQHRRCNQPKIHGRHEGIEYRCRIGTDVSPSGYSRGANRNGEDRCWYSKAKRFSRHSKRALRAYIWRVGAGPLDSARFPATTNGGYRYEKGGGEKRERCGSLVGCVLAWVTEAVHPLPSHPPAPFPSTLLAFEAI